jgi:hypothetical protein
MSTDLALVMGIVIGMFSIPSAISAFSDRRVPRASAVTIIIAGALILYAVQNKAGGYRFEDIPNAFIEVIADVMP